MELISKDDEGGRTIHFNRIEFAALLAIVYVAALEYDSLSVDIHNLSKGQVEQLEDALHSL